MDDAPDLSPEWVETIGWAAVMRRVLVLGATDVGKSTFCRAVLRAAGEEMRLIDLDPGQKMIGPPGSVAIGRLKPARVERFVFIGSTSSASIGAVARAAADLADRAGPFVANTSGFVRGPGVRLQAATAAAVRPDLIVEIGEIPEAPPLIRASEGVELIRLSKPEAARRKSAGARARLRQVAFEQALAGAQASTVDAAPEPGDVAPFSGAARPVCALADKAGVDFAYGILLESSANSFVVLTSGSVERAHRLRLGRMWAEFKEGSWRLLDKLEPGWSSDPT